MISSTVPHRQAPRPVHLTRHARMRMDARRLKRAAIDTALSFGRVVRAREAEIFFVGHKEVEHYAHEGIDLTSIEGIHVVCSLEGAVLTAYRNRACRPPRPHRGWYRRPRRRPERHPRA